MLLATVSSNATEVLPKQLEGVDIAEKLGNRLELDISFTNHLGQNVQLKDYFDGKRPVLLTLNYYRCKTLCNLQLNAVVNSLRDLGWKPGQKFRIVTISIDPREGHELARDKRASYLHALGKNDVDWNFLVGKKSSIDKVANAVGFRYRYIADEDQYAHPAAIYIISPTGTISRYLYGIAYPARQLRFSLIDAGSEGRIGSTVDRILLSCFHYDATSGQYGPFAFGIMRLGGILTVCALALFLGFLWYRERNDSRDTPMPDTDNASEHHKSNT